MRPFKSRTRVSGPARARISPLVPSLTIPVPFHRYGLIVLPTLVEVDLSSMLTTLA